MLKPLEIPPLTAEEIEALEKLYPRDAQRDDSKRVEKGEACSFVLTTGQREWREKKGKCAEGQRSRTAKTSDSGSTTAKMRRRLLSTGKRTSKTRQQASSRALLAQVTRKPRAWANSGKSP